MNEELKDDVSIHALLAECDYIDTTEKYDCIVSIHALLAECDLSRKTLRVS